MSAAIAFLLVFLIVVLVVLLFDISKKTKVVKIQKASYSNKYENINIINLPEALDQIPFNQRFEVPKKILKSYIALNYQKNKSTYNDNTWHSWQISILINVYKKNFDLFIPNPEDIFGDDVLALSDNMLKNLVNNIFVKYKKEVFISSSKDSLSKDLRWSGKEISLLLYFLSRYKEFSKG